MASPFRSLLMVACTLALAACSDGAVTPTSPVGTPAFSANPASEGAVIWRSEVGYIITVWDSETQLLAGHHYIDRFSFCGQGSPTIRKASLKEVVTSGDAENTDLVRALMKAPDAYITVHHSSDGILTRALICSAPIASGFGRVIQTDNDANAGASERERTNAFGLMAQATLFGPEGQPYHYNGVFRASWQPGSSDPDYRYREMLFINLVPQGN